MAAVCAYVAVFYVANLDFLCKIANCAHSFNKFRPEYVSRNNIQKPNGFSMDSSNKTTLGSYGMNINVIKNNEKNVALRIESKLINAD